METMTIPDFPTRKELFKFLVENKQTLIAQKKAIIKEGDGVPFTNITGNIIGINKAAGNNDSIQVLAAINTTNLMDSHLDVHLPGLWAKSLKESINIIHNQEHLHGFKDIIADGKDLKAYTKDYTWKELGFKWEGKTQVLLFDSKVLAKRNSYMFGQYQDGYVTNHSVEMYYVKLIMAINDEDYGAEFEAWEKYYPEIVNSDYADEIGYFWAVKEAKVTGGAAVPRGSNYATPTLDIKEPAGATPNEPAQATHQAVKEFYKQLKF